MIATVLKEGDIKTLDIFASSVVPSFIYKDLGIQYPISHTCTLLSVREALSIQLSSVTLCPHLSQPLEIDGLL